ncbi:MAG TPA: hypothetical protein VLF91_00490 [Candidatus Saccharimonadales bacterium]|nr:hypothetical protein [Candidatus Saccharimonadales bacterium]
MRLSVLSTLLSRWRAIVAYGAAAVALLLLLVFRLNSLAGGYSAGEQATWQASHSFTTILHAPLNAPFLLLERLLNFIVHPANRLLAGRLSAVVFGFLSMVFFFSLLRYWHGMRTALFGTLLFGTSAWFLHSARQGTPDIMLCGTLALLACALWLKHTKSALALLVSFVVATSLMYVPGMIWLVLAGVVWQLRLVDAIFRKNLWVVSIGALFMLGALTPLGLAIYHHPDLLKVLAGLPAHGWPHWLQLQHQFFDVPYHLFIHGAAAPDRWLGQLAVIDLFSGVMALLGGYLYVRHMGLTRSRIVIVLLLLGAVLASLGGASSLTLLVPYMYLLAAAGIGFMLDRWFTVFPRNVIAQSVGLTLVCLAVLVSASYGLRQYFVAWPHAPETRAALNLTSSGTIKR